nr:hypothetical protein [Providencia rettgeri]
MMRKLLLGLLLCSVGFGAAANNEDKEIKVIENAKQEACKGDKNCEKYFVDAVGISAMVSRYHGECVVDKDTSEQCKDAEKLYRHIMNKYENNG